MDDLRTAQLVEFDPALAAAGGIGTIVPRAEFAETAARGEFPATFLIDLDRVEDDVTAHATIALDWDKESLDRLLASTDDEEIALWFDERELAQAFDDVEAQGLRERAAALVVAVAAAGAVATPALARIPVDVGGMGTAQSTGLTANSQTGSVTQAPGASASVSTTASSGGGLSSGEIAAIAGAGAVLISAAGFGVARRRTPPVLPA
jgi:hypothetical protein